MPTELVLQLFTVLIALVSAVLYFFTFKDVREQVRLLAKQTDSLESQCQQQRRATEVDVQVRVLSALDALRALRMEQPTYAQIFSETKELKPEEVGEHFFILRTIAAFEIAYRAHKNGVLGEEQWGAWENGLDRMVHEEAFERFFARKSLAIVDPDFWKHLESKVNAARGARG